MELCKNVEETKMTVAVAGRLDTTTAPQLEKEIMDSIDGITELTLDFGKLEYVSSAGLRVILSAQKRMNKQGKMTVTNVNDDIKELFFITGFDDIITIE